MDYQRLKTWKHSVRIGLSYFGFSFYEHFNRQFTYAVFLCSKPQDVFEQKDFVPILTLLRTVSTLRTFYMSLNSTKNLKKI